jgi:membrane protein implicated in regulation of membrane protease activity
MSLLSLGLLLSIFLLILPVLYAAVLTVLVSIIADTILIHVAVCTFFFLVLLLFFIILMRKMSGEDSAGDMDIFW